MAELKGDLLNTVLEAQRNELTEHSIYARLATSTKNAQNAAVLKSISESELKHHNRWKELTKTEVAPRRWMILKYYTIARIFGVTFGVKLMEGGEVHAQTNYKELSKQLPVAKEIMKDEVAHEKKLIKLINEEKLDYAGSVVLGLNDALVELTGALAGFTLALQDAKLIGSAGLITGIAASMSMAASDYLSKKADGHKNPKKSATYTGIAYLLTVLLLISPFLLIGSPYISLVISLAFALLIIFMFNFYISVAKDLNFRKRFLEMAMISMGVAAISFGIGFVVNKFFGIGI